MIWLTPTKRLKLLLPQLHDPFRHRPLQLVKALAGDCGDRIQLELLARAEALQLRPASSLFAASIFDATTIVGFESSPLPELASSLVMTS